ncbi:MAG: hypothetical protein EHM57_00415 [Actinobacteria bacterium]|nr:MAG: hypothetical protein EHM57_00415 [Actinomycetota bacterium]
MRAAGFLAAGLRAVAFFAGAFLAAGFAAGLGAAAAIGFSAGLATAEPFGLNPCRQLTSTCSSWSRSFSTCSWIWSTSTRDWTCSTTLLSWIWPVSLRPSASQTSASPARSPAIRVPSSRSLRPVTIGAPSAVYHALLAASLRASIVGLMTPPGARRWRSSGRSRPAPLSVLPSVDRRPGSPR